MLRVLPYLCPGVQAQVAHAGTGCLMCSVQFDVPALFYCTSGPGLSGCIWVYLCVSVPDSAGIRLSVVPVRSKVHTALHPSPML